MLPYPLLSLPLPLLLLPLLPLPLPLPFWPLPFWLFWLFWLLFEFELPEPFTADSSLSSVTSTSMVLPPRTMVNVTLSLSADART